LWKPRDCRVRHICPNRRILQGIHQVPQTDSPTGLTFPNENPWKRTPLFCKQLPFFIFPPTRIRRNHQKHLIKRAKKFQEGKWEELWKQSIQERSSNSIFP
jgi:hypothetical protein